VLPPDPQFFCFQIFLLSSDAHTTNALQSSYVRSSKEPPMSVQKCSLCNRPAVWLIREELFCEVHKEEIVTRYGVDLFPVHRLSDCEKQFIVRGRHKQPV
jgi:hypothetical protein